MTHNVTELGFDGCGHFRTGRTDNSSYHFLHPPVGVNEKLKGFHAVYAPPKFT